MTRLICSLLGLALMASCNKAAPPAQQDVPKKSAIAHLQTEPATLFDAGMTRLQTRFLLVSDYNQDWFRRVHPEVKFSHDMAMFWPSQEKIMIHRSINGAATLSNCTLAIETLRSDLIQVTGPDGFVRDYFWHYRQAPPDWLMQLPKSIVLVGDVFDPEAQDMGRKSSIQCESGLTQQEVKLIDSLRTYR